MKNRAAHNTDKKKSIGNVVLQDILFNAGLHPKRKKSTLSDFHKAGLYYSLKVTLKSMADKGGRDTEKDLFDVSDDTKLCCQRLPSGILVQIEKCHC